MKLLSWNIQWGRGMDERVDLPRTLQTIVNWVILILSVCRKLLLISPAARQPRRRSSCRALDWIARLHYDLRCGD